MAIIQDWKIRSTDAKCELTGVAFADKEDFYTCIFDDPESDGFLRRDYSVESWSKVKEELDPPPFSFWRSTYKAPVIEEDKSAIADTSAEGMLRRFIQEDDARTENARYILALMLERKKTLVQTDAKETESRRLLFYEHAQNGDVFIVADPGLKLSELEAVQREVSDLLEAEDKAASRNQKTVEEDSEADEDQSEDRDDEAPESED